MKLFLSLLLFTMSSAVFSQCQNMKWDVYSYNIDNGTDFYMPFYMEFNDKIVITKQVKDDVEIEEDKDVILESTCNWDKDKKYGESIYILNVRDKDSTKKLRVIVSEKEEKIILTFSDQKEELHFKGKLIR